MVMGQNPGAQMVPTVIAGIAGEVGTPKYDHYSGVPQSVCEVGEEFTPISNLGLWRIELELPSGNLTSPWKMVHL